MNYLSYALKLTAKKIRNNYKVLVYRGKIPETQLYFD